MTETWENFGVESRMWQYILHHWWISGIWRMLNYRRNISSTKIDLHLKEISWKSIQIPIHRASIISIINDSCKSHGYHFKNIWMSRTGSWDSICLHSSERGDTSKLRIIPKSECPDIWIRLSRHKWPKSWSSMDVPVVPLERNLYDRPLAGLSWDS